MTFSIITASFRSNQWLKLCIPSVADQEMAVEHLVQDGCSDDGTLDWLPYDRRVKAVVEKDQGMYDAINRGLRRATGDILAYLNCDEQYLPGTLAAVGEFFERHPEVEVVFGDAVVVDSAGRYLCHRRTVLPTYYHTLVSGNLATLTCATFFRRRLITERQMFFDTRFKIVGDGEWLQRLIKQRVPMAVLPRFTSVFTDTGDNLCLKPSVVREQQDLASLAPVWARKLRFLFILQYRLSKLLAGHYQQVPFEYSLYTHTSPGQRVPFSVKQPTAVWKRVSPPASGDGR
ncbi:MAG: glycosyltransferase family 2 protein [Verrucomicrobiota bacterium]